MASLDGLNAKNEEAKRVFSLGGESKESKSEGSELTSDEQVLIDLLRTTSKLDELRNFLFGKIEAKNIERELATSAFGRDFNDAAQLLDPTNFEKKVSEKLEQVVQDNPEVKKSPELQNQLEQVKDKVKTLGKDEVKEEVQGFALRAKQEQQEADKTDDVKQERESGNKENKDSNLASQFAPKAPGKFTAAVLQEEQAREKEEGLESGAGVGGGVSR